MTSDPGYEVWFLPWADIGKEYRVGPFSFTPWSEMQVADATVKAYLDRYFSRHVDHFGVPVKSVAILSHSKHGFEPMAYLPFERPIDAVNVFIFATIGPTVAAALADENHDLAPPTVDRFALVRQNFRASDSDVAVRSGSSIHAAQINKITFPKPWDLGGTACWPCDDLLKGFSYFFDPGFDAVVRARIFRSLEWFRLAHVGGEATSEFAKAVMMATAFEILLQFPESGKRQHFINVLDRNLRRRESRLVTVQGQKGETDVCAAAEWGGRFYKLRNEIVHGDDVAPERLQYEDWITHLVVADLVFWQCVKQELYERTLIRADVIQMKSDPIQALMVPLLEDQLLGFRTHKTLKWTE